jgi:hypothetical protein
MQQNILYIKVKNYIFIYILSIIVIMLGTKRNFSTGEFSLEASSIVIKRG